MTLQVQFITIGVMSLSGLGLGVLFDVYRVLTGQLRFIRRLVPFLDLLYWAAATVIVFRLLIYSNEGQLRLFVFIGLWAGVTLHFLFFSGATVRFVHWVVTAIQKLARFVARMFRLLVIAPLIKLYRFARIVAGFFLAAAIFLFKIVLQLLYPVRIVLRFFGRLLQRRLGGPFGQMMEKLKNVFRKWFR